MNTPKTYFFRSFLIVLMAACFFLGLKEILPKKIFTASKSPSKNVLIDSMLIDALKSKKDSVNITENDLLENQKITFNESFGVTFPSELYKNYKGYQYLTAFYEQLYQLETHKTGKVRIAYFGDSMTDGDMIVQDIRSSFQDAFGGKGVGFVSITSESAASRGSVLHQFSNNWKMQSYLNVKKPTRPFGVNGHVFFANDDTNDTWVKFTAGRAKNTATLHNPTLFYGSSDNILGQIRYQIEKDTIYKNLTSTNLLNTIVLKNGSLKTIQLNFKDAQSVPVYGVNFDNGSGVHVDNFSQRGNSGIPISMFDATLMQAFHRKLHYNLIVLHYGTNVLNYGTKDYSWYERSMIKTVNRLHEGFPGASILIVSTADKATKYDTKMQSDSAVVPLSKAQRNYALKTQSGFVNLYTLMGGDGAMIQWVDQEPTMGNKDYTHFNNKGAKKVAGMIYDQVIDGYKKYKKLRKPVTLPTAENDSVTGVPIVPKSKETDE